MLKFISALLCLRFDMKLRNRYRRRLPFTSSCDYAVCLNFEAIVPSLAYISFCQLAVFRNVRFRNELSCVFVSKISFFFLLYVRVLYYTAGGYIVGKKFTLLKKTWRMFSANDISSSCMAYAPAENLCKRDVIKQTFFPPNSLVFLCTMYSCYAVAHLKGYSFLASAFAALSYTPAPCSMAAARSCPCVCRWNKNSRM